MWTFGVVEPGFFGAVEVEKGRSILFIPRLSEESEIWMGKALTTDEVKEKYQVDEVYYVDEVCYNIKTIHMLSSTY